MKSVGPKGVGVPATGEGLRASLQRVSGELEEARAEICQLNQAVQSRQNAVDFSCSLFRYGEV